MKFKWSIPLLALLSLGLVSVLAKGEKDTTKKQKSWPIFRGNELQTGVASTKLPATLKQLWTFSAKEAIEGTPAIVDGVVYIGSYDGHVYALDLKKGTEKWKYKAGPIMVPVSYHNGRVYVGDEDGDFHCIDAKKGTGIWKISTEVEITSGAAFSGDNILFGTGGEELICVSSAGKRLWKFTVEGGPVKATPSIIGDRTFVAGCDSTLHVIDIKTGKEVSSVELEGQVASTAALDKDRLYVGTMTDQVLAIDWKKGNIPWRFRPKRGRMAFFASVALTEKSVIAGCRNRRIYSLDRTKGTENWSYITKDRIESSPVVVGDRIYAASMDRNLYVLNLANGALIQKITLDSAVLGSPAVADGRLVIGTEKGTIYCFGE